MQKMVASNPLSETLPTTPQIKIPIENVHRVKTGMAGKTCRFYLKQELSDKYCITPGDTVLIAIIKVVKKGDAE